MALLLVVVNQLSKMQQNLERERAAQYVEWGSTCSRRAKKLGSDAGRLNTTPKWRNDVFRLDIHTTLS